MKPGTPAAARLGQFNATIQQYIDDLDQYSLAMLCQSPKPNAWSLGQMYIHVITDTRYFVEQMGAALSSNANGEKDMHADAKSMFVNDGFPDVIIEGPATNTFIPQPQSIEELREKLSAIKAEVNRLYNTFDFSGSIGKTQHPGLQFFSATEWLQFADMHMRHHLRQKKRIDSVIRSTSERL